MVDHGRLRGSEAAPVSGELVDTLVSTGVVTIMHILSGRLSEPISYDQSDDEWVAVIEGSAELDLDGESRSLTAGDWLLIPRRTPHRLLRTSPGTRWLTVHFGG